MDEIFLQLGLNEKESQTFMKLVELGAQPVSVVAKHVGLPRSSMYFTLEKLKEVGVIEEFERSGIKYVRAIPVDLLENVLQQRADRIRQAMTTLQGEIPKLRAMENKLSISPSVRYIEGTEAVKRMYLQEQTQWNKDWISVYNPETVHALAPLMSDPKAYLGKSGTAMELVVDNAEGRALAEAFRGNSRMKLKFLPKDITFDSDIAVTQDNIYLSAIREGEAAAVVILHPQLAAELRSVFGLLWKLLPETKF